MKKHNATNHGGFTALPNEAVRDTRLSLKARGLLAVLRSHSETYTITWKSLHKYAGGEGDTALRSAVEELKQAGYLNITRVSNDGGHLGWQWDVYAKHTDNPIFGKPDLRKTTISKNNNSQKNNETKDIEPWEGSMSSGEQDVSVPSTCSEPAAQSATGSLRSVPATDDIPVGVGMARFVESLLALFPPGWEFTTLQKQGMAAALRARMKQLNMRRDDIVGRVKAHASFCAKEGVRGYMPLTFFRDPEILMNVGGIWEKIWHRKTKAEKAEEETERKHRMMMEGLDYDNG